MTVPPEAYPLIDMIGAGESGGRYDITYGGHQFHDFSQHPNIPVPIPGTNEHSTAAGKSQFLYSTWEHEARKLGLVDFSPHSQDEATWDLANTTYREKTGRDLLEDIKSGTTALIRPALSGQWPSLGGGGGIQPGGWPAVRFGNIPRATESFTGAREMEREAEGLPHIRPPAKSKPVGPLPKMPPPPEFRPITVAARRTRPVRAPRSRQASIPAPDLARSIRTAEAITGRPIRG